MKIVNLTPHAIKIADRDGNVIRTIEPTMPSARVSSSSVQKQPIDGIPFVETSFGAVENLPPPDGETVYVVSQIVIAAATDRDDLVRPDSGATAIRDEKGQIVAVRALTR